MQGLLEFLMESIPLAARIISVVIPTVKTGMAKKELFGL
jgi:hypothetical protein